MERTERRLDERTTTKELRYTMRGLTRAMNNINKCEYISRFRREILFYIISPVNESMTHIRSFDLPIMQILGIRLCVTVVAAVSDVPN